MLPDKKEVHYVSRKMRKIIVMFIIVSFVTSCKSLKKQVINNEYEKDFAAREAPYDNCFAILPFTLNYTQSGCYPIIKINNSFLLLDTGANFTCVSEKGVLDLFYNSYEVVKQQKMLMQEDGNINICNQQIGYWTIPSYDGANKNIPFYYTNYDFSIFDGLIGQDCFTEFSNIIIDYKNKVIVFDGENIKGEEMPMFIDAEGLCFIEFTCNGIKETGLIDTGSQYFILRSSFFEKACEYSHMSASEIEELKNRKINLTEPTNYLFREVKIGTNRYKKMKAKLASDSQIQMSDEARGRLSEYSSLGFPFFENKIIQLDFRNKIFRIKK